MIYQDQRAAREEDGIGEFDDGKTAQVEGVDDVGGDGDGGEPERESVDEGEKDLDADDGIDHAGERLFGEDGVFFDEFGEVVEARGDGQCEEEESEEEAQVALVLT